MPEYETVIGLELHAELSTESKVFCACPTQFGAEPNSQTCPVCLGFPGVLPVLNRKVVEYALRVALAMNCEINSPCIFERKNYFYPDLPKAYQISQRMLPIGHDGLVEMEVDGQRRSVGLVDVHMEEDTGKSFHVESLTGERASLIDFNRSGVPLLEIVSKPDLRSVAEAEAYMNTMRSILLYLGISDCKMEEGSLRFEASVSLRQGGASELGARVEIKNLNSFKAVTASLESEVRRQRAVLDSGSTVAQETMLWDEERGVTEPMRSKEAAHDYRYFPEPDLVPIAFEDEWIARIREELPELPLARRKRFVVQHGLSEDAASVLTVSKESADFFEAVVVAHADAKAAANWITGDLTALLNADNRQFTECPVTPDNLAEMLHLIASGQISGKIAKGVLEEMYRTGKRAKEIVEASGMTQISDQSAIQQIVEEVIRANPKVVEDYKGGKAKSLGFLVGQVMRQTQGRANPQLVNKLLVERLAWQEVSGE